ncbi:OmpA family protein [Zobellella sp. An-6]|uniref:OmpA family protein n=1 Tax=Zobellella sp. An-6 TaxID=3400218 RepID=UPI004042658C
MKRRSLIRRPHSAGLDRWLVSYADYMTLVFALFVVLYAIHASKSEVQQPLLDGMQQALVRLSGQHPSGIGLARTEPAETLVSSSPALEPEPAGMPSAPAEPVPPSALAELERRLQRQLAPLLERQLVEFERDEDWLTLTLAGELLFASGSALLAPNSEAVLGALLPVLEEGQHYIRVRGYADSIPVSNELYASNWQLSAERARAVLEWLLRAQIAAPRLALEAFGEHRPQALGRGERGRALNRRVELAISSHQWRPAAALPSRPLESAPQRGLRVYELPGGGIRISTAQD